jgi:hypothetical protein
MPLSYTSSTTKKTRGAPFIKTEKHTIEIKNAIHARHFPQIQQKLPIHMIICLFQIQK